MKTFEQEWQDFKQQVYRQGMTPEQEKQIRRAFAAGAFVTVNFFEKAANTLPEPEAMLTILGYKKDCFRFLAEQVQTIKQRN